MTRSPILPAIEGGRPFSILMAGGKEYPVPHRDYILVHPKGTFVIVVDDEGYRRDLPPLTMTGIEYRPVVPLTKGQGG